MKPLKKSLICLSALVVLTGCMSTQSSEVTLLQHGYSSAYVTGYHDGCSSGKRAGGDVFSQTVRDPQAYAAGGDYTTGWSMGFIHCHDVERQNEMLAGAIGAAIASGTARSHGSDGVDARAILRGIDTSGLENFGR